MIDPKNGALRLACLKENFIYRRVWNDHPDGRGSIYFWSLIRCQVSPHIRLTAWSPHRFKDADGNRLLTDDEIDAILNPYRSHEEVPEPKRSFVLEHLFRARAVTEVPPILLEEDAALVSGVRHLTIAAGLPDDYPLVSPERARLQYVQALDSHERILVVDLRKKRGALLADFGKFLEEKSHDRTRLREEAGRDLTIWRMRRERKMFKDIAAELGIPIDVAKKGFYRAYELTQGLRYDSEHFRRDGRAIQKEEVEKTCATCPDRDSCDVLCPTVLPYVAQDEVPLREGPTRYEGPSKEDDEQG